MYIAALMHTHRGGTLARITLAALLCAAIPALLRAQAGSGELTGEVRDPSGAVVAGARVSLTQDDTNLTFASATSDGGIYSFSALKPGLYELAVEATGFKRFVRQQIRVVTAELPARGRGPANRQRRGKRHGHRRRLPAAHRDAHHRSKRENGNRPGLAAERAQLRALGRTDRPAWPCRPGNSSRASTAAARAPTNISTTASRCCNRSRARLPSIRSLTPFRNSTSRPTFPRPNLAASTAASSI